MPNNKEHSDHTLQKLGVEAADLHQWMDQPAEWAGSLHRFYRHDPDNPPEWAVKRYGFERASRIMQHHIELDDISFELIN